MRASATTAGLAVAASLLVPGALADPVSQDDINRSKSAEASTSASIADLETQLSQLSADSDVAAVNAQAANEDYLEAKADLDTATAEADEAQKSADDAAAKTASARSELGAAVVQTYQEGGDALSALQPYLTSESLADLADADVALTRAGEKADAQVQSVEALQAVAETMQGIADQKQSEKQAAADTAASAKASADSAASAAASAVSSAQTKRQGLIAQLAAQRNTTVELETQYQEQLDAQRKAAEEAAAKAAAEKAAQEAAAQQAAAQAQAQAAAQAAAQQAAAQAAAQQQAAAQPQAPAPSAPAASSGRGASAVAAAKTFLGVPYVWGGESYNGVDCSGLVMLSYRQVGVSLYHSSRVQYGQGAKVPLSQMQPGDLIFWSKNGTQPGIYHVAMYVGDGQMIEAPNFNMVVRITPVRYSKIMPYAVRP
ncbi:MAG: NlpC/P60 family protein [Actinomyces urogenitalis]|nr:C40 family peptidase [Actinomyces urogenitalis]MCI7457720.1 NlpC/P60 family protein [Actinomyces urogenitalis]